MRGDFVGQLISGVGEELEWHSTRPRYRVQVLVDVTDVYSIRIW